MDGDVGYIDLQVNGYGGVDFNSDDLSPEELNRACHCLKGDQVAGVLVTFITDDVELMGRRMSRLVELREGDPLAQQMIQGIHIEGPFISPTPGFVGAHPTQHARPAELDAMQRLLDAAGGLTRLVTLAPEQDQGFAVTGHLAAKSICVSAGHCDPSLELFDEAIDMGVSMFTHLGNGCPMSLHRHDNIIQRVLSRADRLWITFIADGAHVAFPALGNYLRCVGMENSIVVTDAIAAAGQGPGCYTVGSQSVTVGPDMVPRAKDDSHLVGATTTMPQIARNLQQIVGLSAPQVDRLLRVNPLRSLEQLVPARS